MARNARERVRVLLSQGSDSGSNDGGASQQQEQTQPSGADRRRARRERLEEEDPNREGLTRVDTDASASVSEAPRREGIRRQGGRQADNVGQSSVSGAEPGEAEGGSATAQRQPPRQEQASSSGQQDRIDLGGKLDDVTTAENSKPTQSTAKNIGPDSSQAPFGVTASGESATDRSLLRISAGIQQSGNADNVGQRDLGDQTPIIGNQRVESFIGDVERGFRQRVTRPAGETIGRAGETVFITATNPGGVLSAATGGQDGSELRSQTSRTVGDISGQAGRGAASALNPGSLATAIQETGETLAFVGGETARGDGSEAVRQVGTEVSRLGGRVVDSARRNPISFAAGTAVGTASGTAFGRVANPRLRSAGSRARSAAGDAADTVADAAPDPESVVTRRASDRAQLQLQGSRQQTDTGGGSTVRNPDQDPRIFDDVGRRPRDQADAIDADVGGGRARTGRSQRVQDFAERVRQQRSDAGVQASGAAAGAAGGVTGGARSRLERAQASSFGGDGTLTAQDSGVSQVQQDADTVTQDLQQRQQAAEASTVTGEFGRLLNESDRSVGRSGGDTSTRSQTDTRVDARARSDTRIDSRADTRTRTDSRADQRADQRVDTGTRVDGRRGDPESARPDRARLPRLDDEPEDDDDDLPLRRDEEVGVFDSGIGFDDNGPDVDIDPLS